MKTTKQGREHLLEASKHGDVGGPAVEALISDLDEALASTEALRAKCERAGIRFETMRHALSRVSHEIRDAQTHEFRGSSCARLVSEMKLIDALLIALDRDAARPDEPKGRG